VKRSKKSDWTVEHEVAGERFVRTLPYGAVKRIKELTRAETVLLIAWSIDWMKENSK
jgi:hypothetical protein